MTFLGLFQTLSKMHIFRGSLPNISEFKTFLNIIYEALIMLSSITKRVEIESVYRPLCVSRPSRYVSVINDNLLVSLINSNAAKVD
jgi:hypothetical protein